MQSIFERDFLKIYTAFKMPTRGSVLILKIGWVEPLSLSFWKLLEEAVFENGAGYSRIYLSYLGCKFDFFTCLLVMVMIKTNTTRKQPRIKRSPHGNLPGWKQGTDVS